MSGYIDIIKRDRKFTLETLKEDMRARRNKSFFWPNGTQVYVGSQGSGKTISLVKHLHELKAKYPRAIIVSNLKLNYFDPIEFDTKQELLARTLNIDTEGEYILFSSMKQLEIALTAVNNGYFGVIYVIDEIHTYFNALESKNIPMFVFTEISQQRKQRKLILGTSQLFMRMAKPFREQCDNLIVCRTKFGIFTSQVAYDGMTLDQDYAGKMSGDVKKRGFFIHTKRLRNAFDTYQKVMSGAEQYESIRPLQIANGKKTIITVK